MSVPEALRTHSFNDGAHIASDGRVMVLLKTALDLSSILERGRDPSITLACFVQLKQFGPCALRAPQ